jgi:hypothetical protein
VMIEQSSHDLSRVIERRWAFGYFAGNQAKHASGEHTPSKGLPFRSVEHKENRMGNDSSRA